MNEKNLRPFTSETGKIGGQKSGEARRKRKQIREYLDELLEMAEGEADTNNAAAVAIQILNQAKSGDIKALRLLLEVMGELDRNKVSVEVVNNDIEAAFERGRKQGQDDVYGVLTDKELITIIARLDGKEELPPEEERPVFTPDGNIIFGESELED